MLTIWGRLNSHNVKKLAWLAQEIGLPHQRIDMGGPHGFTSDYLALNPNRMVPAISVEGGPDDGLVMWESNAILRYLAARHAPELWPEDPTARARADRWMDWQFHFADAQREAFLQCVRVPPGQRDPGKIAASAAAAGAMMTILNDELGRQPWLTGTTFGVADVPMGVYVHTFYTLDMERPDLPHLAAWYARLQDRPGYPDHVMIPLT